MVLTAIDHLEDHIASFIGVSPRDRISVVDGMLRRSTADAVGYWLQLVLSMGIATLGLAMGSTAVVIGAMLISPLMQPLIELGMGLATGSLLLSIRASVRTVSSVAVVVLGAAGVTQLLPFHEITPELAARTSPTMIDLFIAVACALAAIYTTVRQGKDVISAAAGTAIGISLVPPLCTAGYGLGVSSSEVFQGALLLFTANFAAIIAITAVTVLLLGFGQVHVGGIEDEIFAGTSGGRLPLRAARLTRRAVGRPLGVLTRLLIPAILLGMILFPLKRALEEVSWQVRVRARVEAMLATVPGAVVRQSLEVRGGTVRVRLFLVGSDADARAVATDLRAKISVISGNEPLVDVTAVPDAATLDAMALQLQAVAMPPVSASPPPAAEPPAKLFASAVRAAVERKWPAAAGEVLRVRASPRDGASVSLDLEITHLGAPLGGAGTQLLEQAWSGELGVGVAVIDRALPAVVDAPVERGDAWLAEVARLLDLTAGIEGIHTCITAPAREATRPADRRDRRAPLAAAAATSIDIVHLLLDRFVSMRTDVEISTGPGWSIRIGREPCMNTDVVLPDK